MQKNDAAPLHPGDILTALALLSRLPAPRATPDMGARAAWAYPLVGLIIGGIAGLMGFIAWGLGLPAPLTALIALATLIIITGAMHEDGLADCADGLWGGWDRESRLKIMQDSRVGSYGVMALGLSLIARWAALTLLFQSGPGMAIAALLASGAISRAAMPALMATLPHARDSGLSHSVGLVPVQIAGFAAGIAALTSFLFIGWSVLPALITAAGFTIAAGAIAKAKIGGQTGDILGATQQLAEISVLFTLVAGL
jgi:adenosylcobinamide-GDP ribazoletransferase